MMAEELGNKKAHILAVPWPAQGHINPMLHLCNNLASKGLRVTLIITTSTSNSQSAQIKGSNLVHFECISDGLDDEIKKLKDVGDYFRRFREAVSHSLPQLLEKLNNSHHPPRVLVYDSFIPWALDIARGHGLLGASFFPQACSVCAVYYHMQQEKCKNVAEDGVVSLPSLPELLKNDMPCFSIFKESSQVVEDVHTDQFSNIEEADWILFNTFDKLEDEIVKWMASKWAVKTVGPTFLSSYLNKQPRDDDNNIAKINLFKPNSKACMEWLNTREVNSVIYVSFGSSANLEQQLMEEIAWGLINSNCYFLWVVRASEESKLPKTFMSESSERGLVVQWCPQLEILAHTSVACFMTHAGWNSVLEALILGVPMIAMPQWVDQTTNAKFVEDVWHIGVRVKGGESGIITRDDVASCVKHVMREERLSGLKENALRLKELAEEAVNEGGSSERNIQDFVSQVISL